MNYALPEKLLLMAASRPLERSLLTRIETLKGRLDTMTVVDAQGETVGEVRNLVLYKRQLHLVIVQPDVHRNWRFMLLSSALVQRMSLDDRTLVMHITQADMCYLPEQRSATERAHHQRHARVHTSVMAPVNQLPAPLAIAQEQPLETDNAMTLLAPIALPTHTKVKEPLLLEHSAMPKMVAEMADASVARSHNPNHAADSTHDVTVYPVRDGSATQPG